MTAVTPVDREVEWLSIAGDGLPALLKASGGPWDAVQGYWPRTPATKKQTIYVLRGLMTERRYSSQRKKQSHDLRLRLVWPFGSSTTATNMWETEQRAFDLAIDALVARIRGTVVDHTHGNRFFSAAEEPEPAAIVVSFDDPARGTANQLAATISYSVSDRDFTA